MVTCLPGGMAGGLCPGSRVLMPRVSGAPRRCPAVVAIGSGSAMVHNTAHCPACRESDTDKSEINATCIQLHGFARNNMTTKNQGDAKIGLRGENPSSYTVQVK